MRRWLFLILFVIPILACNLNNDNTPLPTLASTPSVTASASTRSNLTGTTAAPTTSAAQPDKGDELDKLLDELNNALKNIDTMDDVK